MYKVVDLKGKGLGKTYLETLDIKVAKAFVQREFSLNGCKRFIYNSDGTPYDE